MEAAGQQRAGLHHDLDGFGHVALPRKLLRELEGLTERLMPTRSFGVPVARLLSGGGERDLPLVASVAGGDVDLDHVSRGLEDLREERNRHVSTASARR